MGINRRAWRGDVPTVSERNQTEHPPSSACPEVNVHAQIAPRVDAFHCATQSCMHARVQGLAR